MKTFKQYITEDWQKAVAMGSIAMAAGAGTAAVIGFPVAAGAAIAGAHYALTRDGLRKDLAKRVRRKRALSEKKDWGKSSFKKAIEKKEGRHDARKSFLKNWLKNEKKNYLDKETVTY
jgi:hypothetical protein